MMNDVNNAPGCCKICTAYCCKLNNTNFAKLIIAKYFTPYLKKKRYILESRKKERLLNHFMLCVPKKLLKYDIL